MPNLELLKSRMLAAEADFARISAIDLDESKNNNNVKNNAANNDVKKNKMPGSSTNPWSGEMKANRRKKSSITSPLPNNQDADSWDEEDGEWEWEEEDEEEEEKKCNGVGEEKPVDAVGKADIKINGSLLTIDRSKPVLWSDEEFEEDEEVSPRVSSVPAPPAPPPPPRASLAPPAPPPPPPGPGLLKKPSQRVEQLKKRPTKRPDWNDLMQEIEKYRLNSKELLKKIETNDRSKPMLSKTKVKGVFVYDSEKDSKSEDIMKEIEKGAKLKHVRCNDRSKPNLRGIKAFKRQMTKEEKLEKGFSFGDDKIPNEELEDLDKIKDDLESTKQLLELEVRSKTLLEKDNKRLQAEIEKLKAEFATIQKNGETPNPEILNSILSVRKQSIKEEKRKSIGRMESVEETLSEVPIECPTENVAEEVIEEMEELKEEVDEARKLAEEWEAKYKEMQRQMEDLEGGHMMGKKNSTAGVVGCKPGLNRSISTASSDGAASEDIRPAVTFSETSDSDDWMQKREVSQLQGKLKNTKDKKEIIVRERNLLNERIGHLKENIAAEFEARKKLKKDVKDMNAAFKEEMAEIELMEQTAKDLEDCYYGDDEANLVTNTHRHNDDDEEMEEYAECLEEEDIEDSVEEILKAAEEKEEAEYDPASVLFEQFQDDPNQTEKHSMEDSGYEKQIEHFNTRIEEESEEVGLMRKSNFSLKSKIDLLYDILQTQKEKHYDLKQELNRMLSDIQ